MDFASHSGPSVSAPLSQKALESVYSLTYSLETSSSDDNQYVQRQCKMPGFR